MIVALGKGETDEYKDNLHKVGRYKLFNNLENVNLSNCKDLRLTMCLMSRSPSIYEEKWEYFSQIKQKMKCKSE